MATIKQLEQLIEESTSLKYIAQAYTEISAAKLKKIRAGIEKNRTFFEELLSVLHIVREEAAKRHIKTNLRPKGTISLVLTSNYRFTGSLEQKLIRFFMVNSAKTPTERIVIGKTGQEYLHSLGYSHSFEAVTFKKDLPNTEELRLLNNKLTPYKQVLVYHAKMKSILIQEPTVVDVTQTPAEVSSQKETHLSHIFEPEIDQIAMFFENQITQLLLEQSMLESELARTAARLISMDQAQVNADQYIKKQKILLGQAQQSAINMQLLETAASLLKWRKEMRQEGLRWNSKY